MWRDYSLWNDPAERRRYCIAVLREKLGEGSRLLHDAVRVGDTVEVTLPRNHFPLAEAAERHLLLAGGIGITPIMAMIAELKRRRADFRLYYCARSPERTAFRDELDLLAALGAWCSITMAATRRRGSTSPACCASRSPARTSIIAARPG